MEQLPQGLLPLGAYDQFIIWQLVPDAPKKPRKVPINPNTMMPCDPHDPSMWMDAQTAITTANLLGDDINLGFVFTTADPFWFVDIDNNLMDSPIAQELTHLLAGAAVEISQSGEGLHIFGSGDVPDHGKRNKDEGLEFYTELRFVALTGDMVGSGCASADTGAVMPYMVQKYFAHVANTAPENWTTAPCSLWNGPTDDDILIAKALSSGAAVQAFGNKCTFTDLWENNVTVVSRTYGDSEADAALAMHLSFWTGKDCERIERLMRKSGLIRDKWDRRENGPGYLKITIMKSVGLGGDVYSNKPAPSLPPGPVGASAPAPSQTVDGLQYQTGENQKDHFAGCYYVRDIHRALVPDGSYLKPDQFKAQYGGYIFALDAQGDKTTKNAWEAFTESQCVRFPKVTGSCFRPEIPPGTVVSEEGFTMVNSYVEIKTERKQGDPAPFLELMHKLLPNGDDCEMLLCYMAALVQYPGVKFQYCPVIQGMEGNGKTIIISALAHAVGHRYTHLPKADELGSNFNGWVYGNIFIGVEEVRIGDKNGIMETLKPLISNSRIAIEGKGADQVTRDNRTNWLMCTNHKDAMRVTDDTRRYMMLFTAQQKMSDLIRDGMTGDYFPNLYNWLREEGFAIINDWLREYKIKDKWNPATMCQRAPATSSTTEAVAVSLGGIEQEILEAIDEGRQGFMGGWVSSMSLDRLLDQIKAGGKVPPTKRRALMQSLGYDWHPGLKAQNGRVNNAIMQEGGKPKLYITHGHISINLNNSPEIVRAFMKAQGYVDTAVNTA